MSLFGASGEFVLPYLVTEKLGHE